MLTSSEMWFDAINRNVYDTKMKCDNAEIKCDTEQAMKLE